MSAFGDGTVFCEPLLTGARHVEVQVLADNLGTVWALTERDCSVQRRYQKVIEESPSPAVGPALRGGCAPPRRPSPARSATQRRHGASPGHPCRRVLLPGVQHPAAGGAPGHRVRARHRPGRAAARDRAGPGTACRPAAAGHAIEARLYAEDPARGFARATGRCHDFAVPGPDSEFGLPPHQDAGPLPGLAPRCRVDAGSVVARTTTRCWPR